MSSLLSFVLPLSLVTHLFYPRVQVDIDLPQIAVIGSQSAGKSSLIESISGITLPRAVGTCTRCVDLPSFLLRHYNLNTREIFTSCPTECRLSRSDAPWQWVVSLRFTTNPDGQLLGQARNQTFGKPRLRNVSDEHKGLFLTRKRVLVTS